MVKPIASPWTEQLLSMLSFGLIPTAREALERRGKALRVMLQVRNADGSISTFSHPSDDVIAQTLPGLIHYPPRNEALADLVRKLKIFYDEVNTPFVHGGVTFQDARRVLPNGPEYLRSTWKPDGRNGRRLTNVRLDRAPWASEGVPILVFANITHDGLVPVSVAGGPMRAGAVSTADFVQVNAINIAKIWHDSGLRWIHANPLQLVLAAPYAGNSEIPQHLGKAIQESGVKSRVVVHAFTGNVEVVPKGDNASLLATDNELTRTECP